MEKIITIKRVKPFSHDSQKGLDDWLSEAKYTLGSYFEKNSQKIATGLSSEEEALLLPNIVGVEPTDRDFRKAVENFYKELSLEVDYKNGVRLNISLTHNKFKGLIDTQGDKTVYNTPVVPLDYIKYRCFRNHPYLATSKEEAVGLHFKQCYIEDLSIELEKQAKYEELFEQANAKFVEISVDPNKVDTLLALYSLDPLSVAPVDKKKILRSKIEDNPELFLKKAGDRNADVKYFIEKLLNSNILQREGTAYIFETTTVASNEEAMIAYIKEGKLKDSKNQAAKTHVSSWKARYEEFVAAV